MNKDFFADLLPRDVEQFDASTWDWVLSDEGTTAFSEWCKTAFTQEVSGPNNPKQVFINCVAMPIIQGHKNGFSLINKVSMHSYFYRVWRFFGIIEIFCDNDCFGGIDFMLSKIRYANELPVPIQKKLSQRIHLLSITIFEKIEHNDVMLRLMVKQSDKPWSYLYWRMLEKIITCTGHHASNIEDDDEKAARFAALSAWKEEGFFLNNIGLSKEDKRSSTGDNEHELTLLLDAFRKGNVEVIDWLWNWYSEDAQNAWLQTLSSKNKNKHELVNALYTSHESLVWLSDKLGDSFPRYLLKQISHKVFTQYKKWVSKAGKTYCAYSKSIFLPIHNKADEVEVLKDMERFYHSSNGRALFVIKDKEQDSLFCFEDLLEMVRSYFVPIANLLLPLFDAQSKSQLGLYFITRNLESIQKIMGSVPLSEEEKRQWLNRALIEKESVLVALIISDGISPSDLLLNAHLLYLESMGFDDKSLGEFWIRLANENDVNVDKVMAHINRHVPLHDHLDDVPKKYLPQALSCI